MKREPASPERSAASRPMFLLGAGYLVLAVALGGASQQGFAADAALQAAAFPLLAYALWRLEWRRLSGLALAAIACFAALALWTLGQLVPLPESLWAALAGREALPDELASAGIAPGWRPISLDPDATLRAALAFAPPAALAVLTLGLERGQRRRLLILLLLLGVASATLGLAQMAGGGQSPLRWFQYTHTMSAVGVFANRNHHAVFLVACALLALAWLASSLRLAERRAALFAVLALLVLLLGIALAQSRAGVALLGAASLGGGLMLLRSRRERHEEAGAVRFRRWIAVAAVAGVILALHFGFNGLARRFAADPVEDLRWTLAQTTLQAIGHYGKTGSGAGSFVAAYANVEPPEQRIAPFVNRAHNEWLEWRLESGWPGAALIAAGLVLGLAAAVPAWRHAPGEDRYFARAAALGWLAILLHGFVDYPLRTTAVSSAAGVLVAFYFAAPSRARPRAS